MKIAVLGSAIVGKTLADKIASLGHDVMIGTRDPAATRARTAPGSFGDPPLSAFLAEHPSIGLGTFAEAAAHGAVVFNATSGLRALEALKLAGAANLDGKIVVDLSNPLDFSKGMPPTLSVCNDDSLGEQVQRAFPGAKVVKTLNTVNAHLMVAPGMLAGGDHTMFVCGDDADAKATVTGYLKEWFGWQDVLDLGGIGMSRGTEMYLPLWVRLYGALKNPMFSIKVVR
ncbi:MAG: NAD(P)-binding domain-containing protein [Deltaproteobacteria bacterium]|nr:NAD(P)-binding domain-containing protein [Myxococcales bacterium]MDP3213115.1 NAD(P)-binding domain-containing protein [Deltaproteobacteria bacterium]